MDQLATMIPSPITMSNSDEEGPSPATVGASSYLNTNHDNFEDELIGPQESIAQRAKLERMFESAGSPISAAVSKPSREFVKSRGSFISSNKWTLVLIIALLAIMAALGNFIPSLANKDETDASKTVDDGNIFIPDRIISSWSPSLSPTHSIQPSASLSFVPTEPRPTTSPRPSGSPSMSSNPSSLPTALPTDSISPTVSSAPSGMPTVSLSPTMSISPSALPTLSVSPTESLLPTRTMLPSPPPSLSPSEAPAAASAAPTNFPISPTMSIYQSGLPALSVSPTEYPSISPTESLWPTRTMAPSSPPSPSHSEATTESAASTSVSISPTMSIYPSGLPTLSVSPTEYLSVSTTPAPTPPPEPPRAITYRPGEGTVFENGLKLSTGLISRIIATKNTKVQYDTGGHSTVNFHTAPDGAAVFADPATGGWIYVSNSESSSDGGVGAITFNSDGQSIGYTRILTGTKRNCGGGKTYWNTWITCEETEGGQVWEVDPWGNSPGRQTIMGGAGGAYESAAYDKRNPVAPTFYITTDEANGPLVKFTPDETAVTDAVAADNFTNLLHTNGPTVKYEYFKVNTINESTGLGTYVWTSDLSEGRSSAMTYFVQGEGIDIRDGVMYFTTKADKLLWIINLDDGTFQRTSTQSGAFDSQPDQVARVLNYTDGSTDGILYFCEDGGDNCGVHGRDASGQFFTILSDAGANFSGETSGLAFSPDGMFMYVAFQSPGHIFEIRRTDGLPFQGSRLDIKYHESDDNTNPFRDLVETHQGKAPDASGCEKHKAD